jgi:ubiquinone/menaquinone biosynthesis C-methylase UbiE
MDSINRLFACPICRSNLSIMDDVAQCNVCGINYNKREDVFSFICREMYDSNLAFENAQKTIEFWGSGWKKRFNEPDHKFLFEFDHNSLINYVKTAVEMHRKLQSIMAMELDLSRIEGQVALNIGCAPGAESLILSYFGAKTIAMDITSQAANAAAYLIRKINKTGYGIQGDARFIPIESSSVDFVYSSGVLHHSPDIQRSVKEIYRVLKPGGRAYIMLYATYSLMFGQQRIIGIVKGNISKKRQRKFMSSTGEGAWITESFKNPYTETFRKNELQLLFREYKNVSIRQAGFSLSQLALIGKVIDREKLNNFSDKYLSFLSPYLGACLFITAQK